LDNFLKKNFEKFSKSGNKLFLKGLLKTSLKLVLFCCQQPAPTYLFYHIFASVIGFQRGGTLRNNLESGANPEQYLLL
jgi:hypothetical protein